MIIGAPLAVAPAKHVLTGDDALGYAQEIVEVRDCL